jgi:hypothetical protein
MPEKYAEELYLSKIYGWSKLETRQGRNHD